MEQNSSSERPDQPTIPELPPSHDEQGYSLDGYDWMARLPEGWHAHSSWGREGWDLGNWPYSIVVLYDHPETNNFAHGTYTEGDIELTRHSSSFELYTAVDQLAEWYWRNSSDQGPRDLPKDGGLRSEHRGPFSWERLEREKPNYLHSADNRHENETER